LTQAEQDYPALRSVSREINEVRAVYPCRELLDDQFTQDKFQQDLDRSRYGIVHIATHGEFKSDSAQTFILTHGGRMDLDALSQLITPNQYRGAPVQLLTLSACETAAGDDRAALGLGGVALKAGARTVMATLWSVNDRVSAELVGDFYRRLHQSGDRAKAAALRGAQLQFLGDAKFRRFRHPCYWSAYLIIGDWQ
jgi:CHAT domain-containing protein